ncbi:MAG: tetratricopeptide repeat protein [Verrucomicrobia bacterium]|nr:tetratricopeptide repeat protein [Verrucomicrobiota bacterium]
MDDSKESFNQICLADDRGQVAVVVELCKKHLRKFQKRGSFVWLLYGKTQGELARYTEAEKAIRRAITLCPQKALPIAYAQMGHLFQAKGDFKQAAFWYRKALVHNPRDATWHIFLASNAFRRGLLKQSEAYYRRALKCSEGCLDEAYFNLGGILLGKRDYAEAIKCYQEALKIDPKYKIAKERLDDAKLASLLENS